MPLITTAIPNLIGGVNQQPAAIRNPNDAEAIENAVPSPVEGLTKRPPTEHIAVLMANGISLSDTDPPFVHLIERDETEKYILTINSAGGQYSITDLNGTAKTIHTTLANPIFGAASAKQRKAITIGDVTFILNTTTTVGLTADTVAQFPADYQKACLIWIKQSGPERVFTIRLGTAGADVFTHTAGAGSNYGTNHVATELATKNPGGIDQNANYVATVENSVIYVTSETNTAFEAFGEDDYGGEGMVVIRDYVTRFEDLPPFAPHGYMVEVRGSEESGIDNYWVKFKGDVTTTTKPVKGIWEECAKPGLKYKLDPATMPLILIRQSDGTFFLKTANGTTPTTGQGLPAGSSATLYNDYKWGERDVGDEDTNPTPSFVGYKINDMVYHQNRLAFLSGENLIFSETSEFFNFWRNSALDLLDTDTIDVASSNPRVGKVFAAIPFNRDLVLFTPTNQMLLRSGDVLSPKSIALVTAADFENQSATVKPIPSANSIFFTYTNGNFVGMRELIPQPALDGAYYANDLTDNVSTYISGPPNCIAATTHENLAVVVSKGSIYGYRYFIQNNEKLQSAWFKFTFDNSHPHATSKAVPIWAGFVDSDMYVVFMRTGTIGGSYPLRLTLERIRMGAGINDSATSGKNWLTHLDQRTYLASGQGTYDANTNSTTFNLPLPMRYAAGKTVMTTVDGYQPNILSGTAPNSDVTVATITIQGNYSAVPMWVGTKYSMTYEFSPPYLRGPAGRGQAAMLSGRYQLRYMTVQYSNTAYFRAEVGIKNESTYQYAFTGETLGTSLIGSTNISSGSFRIPIHSKNDNVSIKLVNDSPLPSKFLSCEIEAFYNDRAVRAS